jgi:hypothetical protein
MVKKATVASLAELSTILHHRCQLCNAMQCNDSNSGLSMRSGFGESFVC